MARSRVWTRDLARVVREAETVGQKEKAKGTKARAALVAKLDTRLGNVNAVHEEIEGEMEEVVDAGTIWNVGHVGHVETVDVMAVVLSTRSLCRDLIGNACLQLLIFTSVHPRIPIICPLLVWVFSDAAFNHTKRCPIIIEKRSHLPRFTKCTELWAASPLSLRDWTFRPLFALLSPLGFFVPSLLPAPRTNNSVSFFSSSSSPVLSNFLSSVSRHLSHLLSPLPSFSFFFAHSSFGMHFFAL